MSITVSEVSTILGNINPRELKTLPALIFEAVSSGDCTANEMLEKGLLEGMNTVGIKFKNETIFLPQVMFAAKTMKECVEKIKPFLIEGKKSENGKVCIGTVKGDNHDIGKNIVKIMLEGKGLQVIDLGTDVPPEKFIDTAINEGCKVICCSALLTTTMPVMSEVVKLARASGKDLKIIIGGAPVTQEFADEIGADGYSDNGAAAAELACELLNN